MTQKIKDTIIGTAVVCIAFATIPTTLAILVWMLGV
jgi:hypothetical protein